MNSPRLVIFGNNKVARHITNWLLDTGQNVVAIIPEGRDFVKGAQAWEEEFYDNDWIDSNNERFRKICILHGNINKFAKEMKNTLKPDLLIGCRSYYRVSQDILSIPTIGTTNLHYGDLPRYGGCHTIQHALINCEMKIGVTLHFMSDQYDTGPVIDKIFVPVFGSANKTIKVYGIELFNTFIKSAFDIYQECNITAINLFKDNYERIVSKDIDPKPQDLKNRRYYDKHSFDFKDNVISIKRINEDRINNYRNVARKMAALWFPPFQKPSTNLYFPTIKGF